MCIVRDVKREMVFSIDKSGYMEEKAVEIETGRLIIRELVLSDENALIQMASDGSLKDIGFDMDCNEWMKNWIVEAKELTGRDDPTEEYLAYAIQLKESGIVIGSVGCSYYEDLEKVGVTYFIGGNYRNKGYASEAVKAYIQYFFRRYRINEIIATVREENISSRRVIEKSGFRLGERKLYKDLNDEFEEMYCFYSVINQKGLP